MPTPWHTRVRPAPIAPPIGRRPSAATCARAWPSARPWSAPVRREGSRLRTGAPETFLTRVKELALPPTLTTVIAPLLELLGPLNKQIAALDEELERIVAADEVTRPLTTVPGVGPVTATAFVATVDDVTRFRDAHQVEAYLGLIPCEWSSSEAQRRGHITKAGNGRMRWLLVQAAWCILRRRKRPETAALRDWAD